MRDGRGLRTAFPDIIPFERVDVLEDLKSLVDVHRITDFTLHDRVVPTIELRRFEDELIVVFSTAGGPSVGNFTMVQWFNSTLNANLRPIAIHVGSSVGSTIILATRTVQEGGAQQTGATSDRRKAALSLGPSVAGGFTNFLLVAPTGTTFWQEFAGPNRGGDIPDKLVQAIVLPPGTGINFFPSAANQDLLVNVAYKVQAINPTRPGGV